MILLDGSGSMTGLRKEIARNVVLNILETLSDNDFVTILRVSQNNNFYYVMVYLVKNVKTYKCLLLCLQKSSVIELKIHYANKKKMRMGGNLMKNYINY